MNAVSISLYKPPRHVKSIQCWFLRSYNTAWQTNTLPSWQCQPVHVKRIMVQTFFTYLCCECFFLKSNDRKNEYNLRYLLLSLSRNWMVEIIIKKNDLYYVKCVWLKIECVWLKMTYHRIISVRLILIYCSLCTKNRFHSFL